MRVRSSHSASNSRISPLTNTGRSPPSLGIFLARGTDFVIDIVVDSPSSSSTRTHQHDAPVSSNVCQNTSLTFAIASLVVVVVSVVSVVSVVVSPVASSSSLAAVVVIVFAISFAAFLAIPDPFATFPQRSSSRFSIAIAACARARIASASARRAAVSRFFAALVVVVVVRLARVAAVAARAPRAASPLSPSSRPSSPRASPSSVANGFAIASRCPATRRTPCRRGASISPGASP